MSGTRPGSFNVRADQVPGEGPLLTAASGEAHDPTVETLAVPGRRLAATGGLILLGLGLLIAAVGIGAATGKPVEGIDFGRAIAPFVFAFALPPLVAAVGILRHHRSAKIVGIIVGVLYGVVFLGQGTREYGQPILAIVGLGFLGATISLLDSFRRSASHQ